MSNDARFIPLATNKGKVSRYKPHDDCSCRHCRKARLPNRRRKADYGEIEWLGAWIAIAALAVIVAVFGDTLTGVW